MNLEHLPNKFTLKLLKDELNPGILYITHESRVHSSHELSNQLVHRFYYSDLDKKHPTGKELIFSFYPKLKCVSFISVQDEDIAKIEYGYDGIKIYSIKILNYIVKEFIKGGFNIDHNIDYDIIRRFEI